MNTGPLLDAWEAALPAGFTWGRSVAPDVPNYDAPFGYITWLGPLQEDGSLRSGVEDRQQQIQVSCVGKTEAAAVALLDMARATLRAARPAPTGYNILGDIQAAGGGSFYEPNVEPALVTAVEILQFWLTSD